MLYAFFDGDNIGKAIEILLTENRVSEAMILSNNIKTSLSEIEKFLKPLDGINIIILGGDDILIEFDLAQYNISHLEMIRDIFKKHTKLSMSCGVGKEISTAIWNLHIAKLYGKDMIRGWE